MEKFRRKIILGGLSLLLIFFVVVVPIIGAAAVVAAPVIAIHNFFVGIGDFLFGDKQKEGMDSVVFYTESEQGRLEYTTYYKPVIDAYQDKVNINPKDLWLVNIISVISSQPLEVGQEPRYNLHQLIDRQVKALVVEKAQEVELENEEGLKESTIQYTYSLRPRDEYLSLLKGQEPWATQLQSMSTSTLVSHLDHAPTLTESGLIITSSIGDQTFIYPLAEKRRVTSNFGYRVLNGQLGFHSGIDLGTGCGLPIFASISGTIVRNERSHPPTGKFKGDQFGWIQNGNVIVTYSHLRNPFPHEVGTYVNQGDFVGYSGNTGYSFGCHLHMSIRVDGKVVNPRNFIDFDNPEILARR